MRNGERGLTYLGLLVLLAVLGAGLAQLGTVWSTQAQRAREAELRFRGEQIREAIARYRGARQPAQWPPSLEALLDDRREGVPGAPRHHLRRLWTDPFTGQADWELLPPAGAAPGGPPSVAGVRSRSDRIRITDAATAADNNVPRVSDWRFVHRSGPAPTRPGTAGTGGNP
jgi:type II secretory pathway pseudopilin PulG